MTRQLNAGSRSTNAAGALPLSFIVADLLAKLPQESVHPPGPRRQRFTGIRPVANIFVGGRKNVFKLQIAGGLRPWHGGVAGLIDAQKVSAFREGRVFR